MVPRTTVERTFAEGGLAQMSKVRLLMCAVLVVLGVAACSSSDSGGAAKGTKSGTTTKGSGDTTTTSSGPIDATTTTAPGGSKAYLDATAADYTSNLAAGFTNGKNADGDLVLTKDEATCVAPKWIDAITVATLKAKKVDPQALKDNSYSYADLGLAEPQGTKMITAFDTCGADIYSLFLTAISVGLTPDKAACVKANIDQATARSLLVASLIGADSGGTNPLQAKLQAVDTTCKLSTGG
ncbi:MAG: hypothetical protein JWM89_3456 [Acidimicrobiales bacterium]|nr:hypothetical protein [Acidimicrobiales bacterium]